MSTTTFKVGDFVVTNEYGKELVSLVYGVSADGQYINVLALYGRDHIGDADTRALLPHLIENNCYHHFDDLISLCLKSQLAIPNVDYALRLPASQFSLYEPVKDTYITGRGYRRMLNNHLPPPRSFIPPSPTMHL